MIYYTIAATVCLLALGYLYYLKCRRFKVCNANLDRVINKYVELLEVVHERQKEYNNLADKYRYKLSLIAVLQDKLSEASNAAVKLQKKYNFLCQAYNENKDDLNFAESILSGSPEEI